MFRSLTFKLSVVLLLILGLAGVGQTFRLLSAFASGWAARQEEIGSAVLEQALADGTEQLGRGKLPEMPGAKRFEHLALRLYGPNGELLDRIGDPADQPAISLDQLSSLRDLHPGRPQRLVPFREGVALGFRVDTGPAGPERYLVYSVSREPDAWVRGFTRIAQRNLVIATIIAALASLGLVRWLQRRLSGLNEAFRKVAAGDLTTRVPEPKEKELAALARSFNHMAGELEGAQSQRRQAEDERRNFVAQASHELRTPLTALQGYLETLTMEGFELEPEQRRGFVHRAFLEAQELGHRVDDLMELVRLERPSFQLDPQPVELSSIYEELERRYQPIAASAGVTLAGLIDPPQLRTKWDRRRVVQALGNLLHNAIKASPRGGTISVRLEQSDPTVRIAILDQGPGLDAGYNDPSGLGLGLKIARLLLERHGGQLHLQAAKPTGLCAVAELPASAAL